MAPQQSTSTRSSSEIKDESVSKRDSKSSSSEIGEKVAAKIGSTLGNSVAGSVAGSVVASALSFLPAKSTDELYSLMESTVEEVQTNAVAARDAVASFVKRYPFYALLGAAALGASAVLLMNAKKSAPATRDVVLDS